MNQSFIVTKKKRKRKKNPPEKEKDQPAIPLNQNNFSAEEKRALQKKSQKLKDILGESVDEKLLTDLINKPDHSSLARRRSKYAKSRIFFESISSPEFSTQSLDHLRKTLMLDDDDIIVNLTSDKQNEVPAEKNLELDLASKSESDLTLIGMKKIRSQDFNQTKLMKLHAYLSTINLDVSEKEQLRSDEKKQQLKKFNKLEKMFGEKPPKELVLDQLNNEDSWNVKQKKSLLILISLLEDPNYDLTPILNTFTNNERSSTFFITSTETKTVKPKKLNKLSQFFLNQPSEDQQFEQKMLLEIHHAFAEDINQNDNNTEEKSELLKLNQDFHLKILKNFS